MTATVAHILYPAARGHRPWVHMGSQTVTADTPAKAADAIFLGWNHDSDEKSPEFLAAGCRSFEVGDLVYLPDLGAAYRCASYGWDAHPLPTEETVAPIGTAPTRVDTAYGTVRR